MAPPCRDRSRRFHGPPARADVQAEKVSRQPSAHRSLGCPLLGENACILLSEASADAVQYSQGDGPRPPPAVSGQAHRRGQEAPGDPLCLQQNTLLGMMLADIEKPVPNDVIDVQRLAQPQGPIQVVTRSSASVDH